ncbi:MAG TPA: hypothetical protein PLF40_20255 [Kofleriaceae bacterium]|nr:hypothetical protein [Kofleriaceae bacterium]
MRQVMLLALTLLASSVAAAGTPVQPYQRLLDDAASKNGKVHGYILPSGQYFTHLVVGQSTDGSARALLMHCDVKQCQGATHIIGDVGATIESVTVTDLAGNAPTTFETTRPAFSTDFTELSWSNTPATAPVGALVIKTMHTEPSADTDRNGDVVKGTAARGSLTILSMQKAPQGPLLQHETLRRGASGAGVATTFTFVRTNKHALLDVHASEQKLLDDRSRCLPPDPITYMFTINKGRYTIAGKRPPLGGC